MLLPLRCNEGLFAFLITYFPSFKHFFLHFFPFIQALPCVCLLHIVHIHTICFARLSPVLYTIGVMPIRLLLALRSASLWLRFADANMSPFTKVNGLGVCAPHCCRTLLYSVLQPTRPPLQYTANRVECLAAQQFPIPLLLLS